MSEHDVNTMILSLLKSLEKALRDESQAQRGALREMSADLSRV